MTTSKETEVKSLFKWDNPYSWTYKGNLAGNWDNYEDYTSVLTNLSDLKLDWKETQ